MVKRSSAKRWVGVSFGLAVLLANGLAMGQAKKECQPAGAPETVEGQVVRIDQGQKKVTVITNDGTSHDFQAAPEMLQTVKNGDKIAAKLRELPKC